MRSNSFSEDIMDLSSSWTITDSFFPSQTYNFDGFLHDPNFETPCHSLVSASSSRANGPFGSDGVVIKTECAKAIPQNLHEDADILHPIHVPKFPVLMSNLHGGFSPYRNDIKPKLEDRTFPASSAMDVGVSSGSSSSAVSYSPSRVRETRSRPKLITPTTSHSTSHSTSQSISHSTSQSISHSTSNSTSHLSSHVPSHPSSPKERLQSAVYRIRPPSHHCSLSDSKPPFDKRVVKKTIRRKHTNIACVHCYKAKAGCDMDRPCTRCRRLCKENCVDRPPTIRSNKKGGRKGRKKRKTPGPKQSALVSIPRPQDSGYALFGLEPVNTLRPPSKNRPSSDAELADMLSNITLKAWDKQQAGGGKKWTPQQAAFAAASVANMMSQKTSASLYSALIKKEEPLFDQQLPGVVVEHVPSGGLNLLSEFATDLPKSAGTLRNVPFGIVRAVMKYNENYTKCEVLFEANEAAAGIVGLTVAELYEQVPSGTFKLVHHDDWEEYISRTLGAIRDRSAGYSVMCRFVKKNGDTIRCLQTRKIQFNDVGLPIAVMQCAVPFPELLPM